jgi:hypothetical protein
VAVSDESEVAVPISTDIIDEIPIPGTILSQAIGIGFNFDQVGGHFGLCIGNVLTLTSLIIQREFPAASLGLVLGLSTARGQVAYAVIPIALGAVQDLAHGSPRVRGLHRPATSRGLADGVRGHDDEA